VNLRAALVHSLGSEIDFVPRILICPDAPTALCEMFIMTPAVRPLSSWSTLRIGDLSVSSATFTLDTELPTFRISVAVAVPVTTTSFSEIACWASTKSTVSRRPATIVTGFSLAAKPSCLTPTMCRPAGMLASVNRPPSPAWVARLVPLM